MPFWSGCGTSPQSTNILVELVLYPWMAEGGALGAVEKKENDKSKEKSTFNNSLIIPSVLLVSLEVISLQKTH